MLNPESGSCNNESNSAEHSKIKVVNTVNRKMGIGEGHNRRPFMIRDSAFPEFVGFQLYFEMYFNTHSGNFLYSPSKLEIETKEVGFFLF